MSVGILPLLLVFACKDGTQPDDSSATDDSSADDSSATDDSATESQPPDDTGDDTGAITDPDHDPCVDGTVAGWFYHGGSWQDRTADLLAATSAFVVDSGELVLCGGTWNLRVEMSGDGTKLTGRSGATMDGSAAGPVVTVYGTNAHITGLKLRNGVGRYLNKGSGRLGGGGIVCDAYGTTYSASAEDLELEDNYAGYGGGGIYLANCSFVGRNLSIRNNEAGEAGGGINVHDGATLRLESSLLEGNRSLSGGAINAYGQYAEVVVELVDTIIHDNFASDVGGLRLFDDARASCTATAAGLGGFRGNIAPIDQNKVGAVYLTSYTHAPTYTSTGCDYGADGTADDNGDWDVWVAPVNHQYDYGDNATFSCDGDGCQ